MTPEIFTRRDFLCHLTLAGAATLLPPAGKADAPHFVSVGRAATFENGQFHAVALPNGQAAYVKRLSGSVTKFFVLSAVCTHKGCRVAWNPGDHKFHCPCHGGQFDAAGRNVAGPPPRPLARLAAKVQNGVLFVQA